MLRNDFLSVRSLFLIAVGLFALALIGCGSAEEDDETTAAPAPAPAQAPPPAAAPAPAPAPAPAAAPAPTAVPEEPPKFTYVAAPQSSNTYPAIHFDGPTPTEWSESPASAALVAQGEIRPLEERAPVVEDRFIVAPVEGIGEYGGQMRFQHRYLARLDKMAISFGWIILSDGAGRAPGVWKSFEVNDEGTEYTFKLREGARWSDGFPLTMEDIRFSQEDFMLNKEAMPGLPGDLKSPLTGNDYVFEVVDDTTFKMSFDSPHFTFIESKSNPVYSATFGCPRCLYAPAHVWKRYHPRYNLAEIDALLTKWEQPNWTKLVVLLRNHRGYPQATPPGVSIPTTYDPTFMYKGDDHYIPWMGGFLTASVDDDEKTGVRNHYSIYFDPEGNQLPYMDGIASFKLENRETAAFRLMAGEVDGCEANCPVILSELPLYTENMEKGDYSIDLWRHPAGGAMTLRHNQEFNEDPEIGGLMRTPDFRKAVSLAWNRNEVNEIVFAGLGTPQQQTPAPGTPYYPGTDVAQLDIEHDPEQAMALMAKLGYTDGNGDGYMDRKDGGGPLTMLFESSAGRLKALDALQANFKDGLGIKLVVEEGSEAHKKNISIPPTQYLNFGGSSYNQNPWMVVWTELVPVGRTQYWSPAIGSYFATRGEEGMAPTGPSADYTDTFGMMAPAGTYPADIFGNILAAQELWAEGQGVPSLSPRRIELGKEFFRGVAMDKFLVGGIAFASDTDLRIRRNNFRNVPKNWTEGQGGVGIFETFYFEGGMDNLNNPGNRSEMYKSVSFADPDYWDN